MAYIDALLVQQILRIPEQQSVAQYPGEQVGFEWG
tara:strand:+ start:1565 stop:1669 length:105 start_codon:yes stop_codon:yes gene_type:complete